MKPFTTNEFRIPPLLNIGIQWKNSVWVGLSHSMEYVMIFPIQVKIERGNQEYREKKTNHNEIKHNKRVSSDTEDTAPRLSNAKTFPEKHNVRITSLGRITSCYLVQDPQQ